MFDEAGPGLVSLLVVLGVVGFVPFIILTTTSFVKISVILFILRNALGIQQTPPNMVIYAIAGMLSAYIMAPHISEIINLVIEAMPDLNAFDSYFALLDKVKLIVEGFLSKHAQYDDVQFFWKTTDLVWKGSNLSVEQNSLFVLVPAFLTSELTRAFEIGVLLYIPFIVIDFAVSAILVAIGMQMMSPPIISVPIKLILFVAIDGWSRIVEGLVLSYTIMPGGG